MNDCRIRKARHSRLTVSMAAILCCLFSSALAGGEIAQVIEAPKGSPYAGIPPEPPPQEVSFDYFNCDWFSVPVTRGDAAFFVLYMPFKYTTTTTSPDFNQSYLFPNLLSFKMDWLPRGTTTRHPYFVYKRDRSSLPQMRRGDPQFMKSLLKDWGATHYITGAIHQVPAGWTGSYALFDGKGKELLKMRYEQPMTYFDLIGQMTLDLFAFFNEPVSPELRTEILRPFTQSDEALRLLGQAALVEERSDAEWALYEKILKIDPRFGLVRYWYANQKQWEDGNESAYIAAKVEILDSEYLLAAFDATPATPALRARYVQALERAYALIPRHPHVAQARLRTLAGSKPTEDQVRTLDIPKIEEIALRCNGNAPFLLALSDFYELRLHRPDKAVPYALSAFASGYQYGSGDISNTLAFAANCLGLSGEWKRSAVGLEAAAYVGEYANSFYYQARLGWCYSELMQHRMAAKVSEELYLKSENPEDLNTWILSLYAADDPVAAEKVHLQYRQVIEKEPLCFVVPAMRALYAGRPEEALNHLRRSANVKLSGYSRAFWADAPLLHCMARAAISEEQGRKALSAYLLEIPQSRRAFLLLDKMERRNRTALSGYMYEAYLWMHPDDSVVQAAKAAAAEIPPPEVNASALLAVFEDNPGAPNLTDYSDSGCAKPPEGLPPMWVEYTLKKLIERGDFEMAEKVAKAYVEMANRWKVYNQREWCNLVEQRVLQAHRRATKLRRIR